MCMCGSDMCGSRVTSDWDVIGGTFPTTMLAVVVSGIASGLGFLKHKRHQHLT